MPFVKRSWVSPLPVDPSPPPTQAVREASGFAGPSCARRKPPTTFRGRTHSKGGPSCLRPELPFMLTVLAALAAIACCAKNATASQGEGQPMAWQAAPEPAPQEQARPEPTNERPPMRAEIERDCPMTVPGAQARAEDTSEGVLLRVTTPEEAQVAELRQRSYNMLQRQQEQGTSARHGMAQAPGIDYDFMGGGRAAGSAGSPSVPSYAHMEETAQGVAIFYSAKNPSQRARLRSDIRETAEKMEPGQCPGMAPAEPG